MLHHRLDQAQTEGGLAQTSRTLLNNSLLVVDRRSTVVGLGWVRGCLNRTVDVRV